MNGVPAVEGNSQWHKKNAKNASRGKDQFGEMPVEGSASWENCRLGDVPVAGLSRKMSPLNVRFFPNLLAA